MGISKGVLSIDREGSLGTLGIHIMSPIRNNNRDPYSSVSKTGQVRSFQKRDYLVRSLGIPIISKTPKIPIVSKKEARGPEKALPISERDPQES